MIKVTIKGADAVKARLAGMGKQVAYAASRALNATGQRVADAMPSEIERAIDKPTPFTKRGVAILRRANKTNLQTTVGFRRAQAAYMRWQIEGGVRNPGAAGLRLPAAIKVNEFGNIPRGVIGQLVAAARKERGIKKATARRVKVSASVALFYGDPVDQKGKPWPRGIYKDVNGALIPLILFPNTPARYKPRFDFPAKAAATVDRVWAAEFDKALAEALRTAR